MIKYLPHECVQGAEVPRTIRGMDDTGRPNGKHCGDCMGFDNGRCQEYGAPTEGSAEACIRWRLRAQRRNPCKGGPCTYGEVRQGDTLATPSGPHMVVSVTRDRTLVTITSLSTHTGETWVSTRHKGAFARVISYAK